MKKSAGELDLGLVYTTCGTREEALKIARTLVQKKLVACANVGGAMQSVYFWQDKLCEEGEVPLLLKTRVSLFDTLRRELKQLHSYTCPCVLMWPIHNAAPDYATWLEECLGRSLK